MGTNLSGDSSASTLTHRAVNLLNISPVRSESVSADSEHDAFAELQALRQAALFGEQQKLHDNSIRKESLPSLVEPVGNYAAPLSPLRERDLKALAELFQRQEMATIEADLTQMLLRLLPEPCWEEDPFEFLREFL